MSAGIGDFEPLIPCHAPHAAREVPREVVVEAVPKLASGQVKLSLMIVGCGIEPTLLTFRTLSQLKPDGVPALEVLNPRRRRADLLDPIDSSAVEQWSVERIIHALVGEEIKVCHAGSFQPSVLCDC